MARIILNRILSGKIKQVALAFSTGNDEDMKKAMQDLVKFEKENKLVKMFTCPICEKDITYEPYPSGCMKCSGKEE